MQLQLYTPFYVYHAIVTEIGFMEGTHPTLHSNTMHQIKSKQSNNLLKEVVLSSNELYLPFPHKQIYTHGHCKSRQCPSFHLRTFQK